MTAPTDPDCEIPDPDEAPTLAQDGSGVSDKPAGTDSPEKKAPSIERGSVTEKPGDTIGSYKLLQQIGEGGFGVVYMAEQRKPIKRKVALKIIKPGMDTKEVIARFEAERQALALMDHPHIAKVLDVGATETGRPFFAMELVKGVSVTEYCDTQRLKTRQRLDLFREICGAVQHAHQKGVIHRDIKPSNILVTLQDSGPVVKVIDFGIAKAISQELTEKTLFTAFGQMIGTPQYMSPEQSEMSGLDVDTRSDIYSLGVVLYELLTGRTPLDPKELRQAGLEEIHRLIREKEPAKPSTKLSALSGDETTAIAKAHNEAPEKLCRLIRGDLDWIVMKALEKDRSRRYETATGIAEDVRRYLEDEPVAAGPPSISYQLGKFVRRNRGVVVAVASIVFLLIAGICSCTWFAMEERQQRSFAEANEKEAEALLQLNLIQRAEASFEQGRYEEGVAILARVLRDNPSSPVAAERLGNILVSHFAYAPLPVIELKHELENQESAELYLNPQGLNLRATEFSSDGSKVVTASNGDTMARLWDARTGELLCPPLQHKGIVAIAGFSPNGNSVVTVSWDSQDYGYVIFDSPPSNVQIWNAVTGVPYAPPISHPLGVSDIRFSPDGDSLCVAVGNSAQLWSVSEGEPLTGSFQHQDIVKSVRFSGNGDRIVTASADGIAQVWNVETGMPIGAPMEHGRPVMSAEFDPDDEFILTTSNDFAVIWNARTGLMRCPPLYHDDEIVSAEFSPDGGRVLTGCRDGNARLWDSLTGQMLGEPMRHEDDVHTARFSPNGELVVTASFDRTARFWEAHSGAPLGAPLRHEELVWSADFSPDGMRVLTVTRDSVARIWEATRSRSIGIPLNSPSNFKTFAFHPAGKTFVVGSSDGTARVFEMETLTPVGPPMHHRGPLTSVEYDTTGSRIVTASKNGAVAVWDWQSAKELCQPMHHPSEVHSAQFSPDGAHVLTASVDGALRIWDADTGQLLGSPLEHEKKIRDTKYSPDGKIILTVEGDHLVLWDVTNRERLKLPMSHGNYSVNTAEFSSDGASILTSTDNGKARLWNARSGRLLHPPMNHPAQLHSASFSPDGTTIVTAAKDGFARFWSTETGRQVGISLRHDSQVLNAQFSSDGHRIVTLSERAVRVWDAHSGSPLTEPILHSEAPRSEHSAVFSPDSQYVVAFPSSACRRIWGTPRFPLPVPDWFSDWAEAAVGKRMTENGVIENVSQIDSDWFFDWAERMNGANEYVSQADLKAIRKRLTMMPKTDFYTRLAHWFFSDQHERTISPWSSVSRTEYVRRSLEAHTESDYAEVLLHTPTNAQVYEFLSEDRGFGSEDPQRAREAHRLGLEAKLFRQLADRWKPGTEN